MKKYSSNLLYAHLHHKIGKVQDDLGWTSTFRENDFRNALSTVKQILWKKMHSK